MELKAPPFFILSVKDQPLVGKGHMAQIIDYINERIDLPKYGTAVEGITYSPTISEKLPARHRSNKNQYLRSRKEWFLNIDLDYHKALQMNDWQYDQYILEGFLQCLERPGEVKGFDKVAFKKDILEIIGALLRQAA